MDRNALARKRRQEAAQPTTKPPVRIGRDKKQQQQESLRRAHSGRIKTAKDSSEIIRVPKKAEAVDRPSHEEDPNARHFMVHNVGRNGTVYLKPSRFQPAQFAQTPATPPGTSDGMEDRRQSSVSGTWTPQVQPPRSMVPNPPVPVPPPSMANTHSRGRARSHSFSTVDGSMRSPTFDSTDFQILLNGKDTNQRPKSSVDLSEGLMDFRIPHYRLGTPRFSERGTAYLHNSMYTSTTSDMRSSVFSRAEYDKLFPAPPGRDHPARNSSPYLHPSQAYSLTASRTPPTPASLVGRGGGISIAVYDKIEQNINDPSIVRYSPTTGRITAATPARLIAQITSPLFLDYELLADFFLTFRNFLSCHDLLGYLLTRMKWALANDSDAGRIVRVRTFVALRHWILNYFADDFVLDLHLRQRFCNLVNELVQALRQRFDRGGTDMSVMGELKKCWRRTCVMFWPVPDALDTSAEADILPGDELPTPVFGQSTTSLPLSTRQHGARMDFRRSSVIPLPPTPHHVVEDGQLASPESTGVTQRSRTASIPASPMSEHSLTVLCCSVPFLQNMLNARDKSSDIRPPGPPRNPALSGREAKAAHGHTRSGSFSDALRDDRPPLPSHKPESVDIRSLRSITFTGGLVRGLLLQPSPSKVDLLIPLSPGLGQDARASGNEQYFQERQQPNASMKRLVGDVRRALSSRKERLESPASSHRSTNSSDSRTSTYITQPERRSQAWQQLRGPPRIDVLGERIEGSYKEAFLDNLDSTVVDADIQERDIQYEDLRIGASRGADLLAPDLGRLNSHVTTGSRSIVIANDTGFAAMPTSFDGRLPGALPSVSSWSSGVAQKPLFRNYQETLMDGESQEHRPTSSSPTAVNSEEQPPALPSPRENWPLSDLQKETTIKPIAPNQARKSSSAHPTALDLAPIRNQLRRRPGGDLKAADNVQDLEPTPRAFTGDSFSTFTDTSGVPSHDLTGTHFSGQKYNGLRLPSTFAQSGTTDSVVLLATHSSQPNMRPSFQKQVSHLARLPDRDGGIEDALAKLEGKSTSSAESTKTAERNAHSGLPLARQKTRSAPLRVTNVSVPAERYAAGHESHMVTPRTDRQGASIYHVSESDANSGAFLDAGAADSAFSGGQRSAELGAFAVRGTGMDDLGEKPATFLDETEDAERPAENEAAIASDGDPKSATSQGSFLLDDNESLSDISTEIAEHSGDDSLGVRSFFFDDTVDEDAMAHRFRAPPTPPSTVGPSTLSPQRSPVYPEPVFRREQKLKEAASAPKLLTSNQPNLDFDQRPPELRRVRTSPSNHQRAHLPFVLAFESDIIAEQLTIIEKDALDEVDWKDLIGLIWQQNPPRVNNWVDFLKEEANGIDIVIARFNLAVKWVVSECVLTQLPSERARCITKFIHIAAHCHRLRNYASMYQITLALLSSDLSRLQQTWSLVAPAEKQTLSRLEKLCQPLRNFHHLRAEMESSSTEKGCIPFIGLYTHDLMFNAQKPARIDPIPPGKEPLVNFERFQTAATIVKGLLRLVEASSRYVFHPHPECLARCLWLAALEDREISEISKGLEK